LTDKTKHLASERKLHPLREIDKILSKANYATFSHSARALQKRHMESRHRNTIFCMPAPQVHALRKLEKALGAALDVSAFQAK
jgi:hypothetical protein